MGLQPNEVYTMPAKSATPAATQPEAPAAEVKPEAPAAEVKPETATEATQAT